MYSGMIAALLLFASLIFFLLYKRQMVTRLFTLDYAEQVKKFEEDIKITADNAVKRIYEASEELSQKAEQAAEIAEELKIRAKIGEEQLYKISLNEIKHNVTYKEPESKQRKTTDSPTFAEHLIKATYVTALHLNDDAEVEEEKMRNTPHAKAPISPVMTELADVASENDREEEVDEEKLIPVNNILNFPQNNTLEFDMTNAEPKFRRKQIARLIANGYDDMFIAKALRLGIGEVTLTRKLNVK